MNYPGQPYFPPPPRPPKPGISPVAIVLIVCGGLVVVGGFAVAIVIGLVYAGARAEADAVEAGAPVATSPPTEPAGSASSNGLAPLEEDDDSNAATAKPTNGKSGAAAPTTTASSGGATGSWWCTASASVRVCGFAGACNYQMVFGNGSGKDRFLASQQAKNACESMARAKGSPTVCPVQCSAR